MDLGAPNVIKIDVEGHEARVLKGAERILSEARPSILFESLRLQPLSRTLAPFNFLGERGYVFFLPAWLVEEEGRRYFIDPLPIPVEEPATANLGLVPFRPEERFLLNRDVNVLAWPEEHEPTLRALFNGMP